METGSSGAVADGALAADRCAQEARMTAHRLGVVRQDYELQSAALIDRMAKLEEQQMALLYEMRQMHRQAGLTWDQATQCLVRDLEALSRALRPRRRGRQPGQIEMMTA